MIATVANLFVIKAAIVLGRGMTQSVMVRMIRLNQHASRQVAAAGAARHLCNQLESSFSRAKIRQRQSGVDGNYAHQSDVVKIMTLREHLRTDQEIDLTVAEIQQGLFEFMTASLRVAIYASNTKPREAFAQNFFDLFSAFADIINVLAGTCRTMGRSSLMMIAVMTNQGLVAAVISQSHVAIRTLN